MSLKAALDLTAAVFALLAALVWFLAAMHPVALPSDTMWSDSPAKRAELARLPKILRGARLNALAAALTGCSALAMFLSWLACRPA